MSDDLTDSAADRLYALPLDRFIAARDELAGELRSQGQRDAAAAVRALRKPNGAAWAINQLVHRRRADIDALLEMGTKLRDAQEQLLGGGGRAALDSAREEERRLVQRLADDATVLAAEAGLSPTDALADRIRSTLHAAALDEQAAAELATGRVLRDRQAVGFSTWAGAAQQEKRHAPAAPKRRQPDEKARRARELRRDLQQAQSHQRTTARHVQAAEQKVHAARARADRALAQLQEAQAQEREARATTDAADADVRRLTAELERLER